MVSLELASAAKNFFDIWYIAELTHRQLNIRRRQGQGGLGPGKRPRSH